MYIDNTLYHLRVFLLSVGFGFLTGIFYDITRIVRNNLIKNKKAVFIQDILFFFFSALLCFLFLLSVNDGRFRFYIFAAVLSGFTFYYFSVGRLIMTVSPKIFNRIKHFLFFSGNIISLPFRLLFNLFVKICKKTGISSGNSLKKFKINQKSS